MKKVAVLLCGGLGARLRPYTVTIPKPLMPLGEGSILEILIRQLKDAGFCDIVLAVNYRAEMIQAYCGTGEKWGVSIKYCEEVHPLGTVGPLSLIPDLPEKFLLINGDVLTDLNFKDFFDAHGQAENLVTVSLNRRDHCIDFGVFDVDETMHLKAFREKPTYTFAVSMGVYCLSKDVLSLIPHNQFFGFDDLMKKAIAEDLPIICRYHEGFWLDIGRHEDYAKAQDEWPTLEKILFPDTRLS